MKSKIRKTFLHRNWRSIFTILSIVVDFSAVLFSFFIAYKIRFLKPVPFYYSLTNYLSLAYLSGGVFFAFGLFLGLYRESFRSNIEDQYNTAIKAYIYGTMVILAILFLTHSIYYSRIFIALFWGILPFLFYFLRTLLYEFNLKMQKLSLGRERVLVIGIDDDPLPIVNRFKNFPELGYDIVGVIQKKRKIKFSELEESVQKDGVDHIFLISNNFSQKDLEQFDFYSEKTSVGIKLLSPASDRLLKISHVHDITGIPIYLPRRYRIEFIDRIIKRAFDFVGSFILILLFLPAFITVAILIRLESRGPVLFKQKRSLAKGYHEFYFYKFRSMIKEADEIKEELFDQNEMDGALFKIREDPRVTKVGRFLRKFSLDETPQLFNVLIGDMSLVGPRPLPVSDYDRLSLNDNIQRFYQKRAHAKPGITGLWQISGRSNIGFEEMILLDLYYIENRSLLFDLEILFETIPVALVGRGAY